MQETAQTITMRAVVFKDNGLWVAQCLEYDIGAQAHDLDTLHDRFAIAVKWECQESITRHGKPMAGIPAAPERFQQMWERRARSMPAKLPAWVINNIDVDLGLVA